jgi:MerR family transcriptional regulator, thiopeptide resistance regulator
MDPHTPAALARRLGIGLKALRLWEVEGLIKPHRLANGWRVFRPDDITAAWRVVALRRLGFPLKAIKALLHRGEPDLDALLAYQESLLIDQARQVGEALSAIASARNKLAAGESLDVDALIKTHVEIKMADPFTKPVLEKLWQKTFEPEQIEALRARPMSQEEEHEVQESWANLISEAERLRALGDPASPEAQALGRAWMAEVKRFTGGDAKMHASSYQFYNQGFADPKAAAAMPFSAEVWHFVGQIIAGLAKRGEVLV